MIYDANGKEYKNPVDAAKAKRIAEKQACALLARNIRNNDDLREVLRQAIPGRRRDVYNFLIPYLKFRCLSFSALV